MSFLAPLFLFGFVFIAGPVIFHLIRQVPRKRILFSSTELLDESEPKTEKSRKLQNPWLLLIRCLIIALLTLAFARPFFPEDQRLGDSSAIRNNVIIAIDESASMGREGISRQRNLKAGEILQSLKGIDQVSVFTYSDIISNLLSPEEWNGFPKDQRQQIALKRIENLTTSQRSASLKLALEEAAAIAESMQEDSSQPSYSTIYLLSDFSNGTYSDNLDSIDWPQYLELVRLPLPPQADTVNLGIGWAGWTESETGTSVANLAITSSAPDETVSAEIKILDEVGNEALAPKTILLEGQSQYPIQIEIPDDRTNVPLRFVLEGDLHPFDNELPVAPPYVPEIEIAVFSDATLSDSKGAPYFLEKAIHGLDTPRASLSLESSTVQFSDAFLIDRPLSLAEAERLGQQIRSGKHALITAQSSAFTATLNTLTETENWIIQEQQGKSLLIGEVDLKHPLLAPFTDSRFSNFSNIRFFESAEVQPPPELSANTILGYDNGSPLLLELKQGTGTILIWTGPWTPQSSQWLLSSKFVPFLHQFLLRASGGPSLPSNVVLTAENLRLYQPLFNDELPGIRGHFRDSTGSRTIAFQLPPQESQTRPFDSDEWDQLGLPEFSATQRQQALETLANSIKTESTKETEQRQRIWQWVLWLVLGLLLLESGLAIAVVRRKEIAA